MKKNDFYSQKIVRIEDLTEYDGNSRKHTDSQIKSIKDSIQEFGFTNPILIDEDNMIIAGHCRYLAAKKLKMQEVPAIILTGLNDDQKRAYTIADNQLALNSDWDYKKLKDEVNFLIENNYNTDILGLDEDIFLELDEIDLNIESNAAENQNFPIVCETLKEYKKITEMFGGKKITFKEFSKWAEL